VKVVQEIEHDEFFAPENDQASKAISLVAGLEAIERQWILMLIMKIFVRGHCLHFFQCMSEGNQSIPGNL
jgi:hypothetical protein